MMFMTGLCWWAFTYRREGFIPQMYGSMRACCAATSELEDFPKEGIQWGDRKPPKSALFKICFADTYKVGEGEKFRHAGFSASGVGKIVPAELYCGRETIKGKMS